MNGREKSCTFLCKFNIKKIELFDIFDKDIYIFTIVEWEKIKNVY